ncbi:MAG: hypothetical protein MUE44_02985 [Oscillatoriaceae cyanobacterium Prado104]|nr:hypothetical protein [Oscillatoriaceae cyanobacterium Prado104]
MQQSLTEQEKARSIPELPKPKFYNPDGKYNPTDTVCHNTKARSHP